MSEPTIEQLVDGVNPEPVEVTPEDGSSQSVDFSGIFNFLKCKTGDGPIENYLDHPFNVENSKGMARVIRGVTGIFGNIDLAVVDIAIGFVDYSKEKRAVNAVQRTGNI